MTKFHFTTVCEIHRKRSDVVYEHTFPVGRVVTSQLTVLIYCIHFIMEDCMVFPPPSANSVTGIPIYILGRWRLQNGRLYVEFLESRRKSVNEPEGSVMWKH